MHLVISTLEDALVQTISINKACPLGLVCWMSLFSGALVVGGEGSDGSLLKAPSLSVSAPIVNHQSGVERRGVRGRDGLLLGQFSIKVIVQGRV